MKKEPTVESDRPIEERAAFDAIRYGSVWEDADILCEALAPVAKGGRLLTIASSGATPRALDRRAPADDEAGARGPPRLAAARYPGAA